MARYKGSTTQRGLGAQHQRIRARLLPLAIGTWCPLRLPGCDGLMVDPKRMDLDHSTPRVLGGVHGDRITCRHCNRSSGATLGNRMRGARRAGGRAGGTIPTRTVRSRQW